jgi:diaminohydroxyphosphoribosylaminopyrimidine deaminase/5-amino-6-(5-phosphoribosylamino)uracil reductase
MAQALALGALADGATSPNPRVGCVLVRDGRVVGRGYHRAAGDPHAEALALAEAGAAARGATVYVNLEPCAHRGRTPPCDRLLLGAGVARVVASIQDPDPRVDGRGFATLRQAGVELDVGLLADEARALNDAFLHWHVHGRPLVTLKAALTLDGMTAAAGGRSQWITGLAARRFAHRLRLRHDAVLVGAETLRRDDPRLTVRLPGVDAHRARAVLTSDLRLDPRARLFEPGAAGLPRLYTTAEAAARSAGGFRGRAEIVPAGSEAAGVDPALVLDDLGRQGAQSVLVEGGARTHASFLRAGLADRAALFVAPRLLGARGGRPLVDLPTLDAVESGWRLLALRELPLGEDRLVLGRLEPPGGGGGRGASACSPA